ncbi:MAG TPA: T9SS type A sorting domain-containing protein, partial [Bacteroidia bacterium]|nr:T9SS type A sorting domain-containing protein [Bacteroidia bacterium]
LTVNSVVEIYNVLGEKVYTTSLPQTPKGALMELNISDKPNGIYFVKIITNTSSQVVKFIKQ